LHRQAPGFGDAALGLRLGRRAEVVGPVRLGVSAEVATGLVARISCDPSAQTTAWAL
jgi:hypothetical protein